MIGDELNNIPGFLQPNRSKQLTLDELRNERKRLEEIQRINKLKMQQADTNKRQQSIYSAERAQRIQDLKTIGHGAVNVLKGGLQKVSEFDKSRANAKPIIPQPVFPLKNKSIYR